MHSDIFYAVALSQTANVGGLVMKQLIAYCGSPEEVFKKTKVQLMKIPGIGETIAKNVKAIDLKKTEKILADAERYHINILYYQHDNYPIRLKHIYDNPCILFTKGDLGLNAPKMLSIVGTRDATVYGKEIAQNIISELEKDIVIVSGMALGIDYEAHKNALDFELKTLGIMANGLDIIYPADHSKLARSILENGGSLMSEYPLGTKPNPKQFPARNRVIAGIADATLVIEAAEKGGALITAEMANSYNKEVFAVPGNINHKFSRGCNQLIKNQKAQLITSGIELMEYMNWQTNGTSPSKTKKTISIEELNLEPKEEKIVAALAETSGGLIIDELGWKTQTSVNELASNLLTLELKGIVKCMPGKKYTLSLH